MTWKPIADFEGLYEVSNFGEVRSLRKGALLKPSTKGRYPRVDLSKQGVSKHCSVHRLVALAFLNNPDNKPYVNHIDFDTNNNKAANLEWCTPKENTMHSVKADRWAEARAYCKNGHERTPENLYTDNGCKQCKKARIAKKKLAIIERLGK